jgi:hypothetical protein
MDNIDEIRVRMRISNLEAKLALFEIDIAALDREIERTSTTSRQRAEGIETRFAKLSEWRKIKVELDEMRKLFPAQARHGVPLVASELLQGDKMRSR